MFRYVAVVGRSASDSEATLAVRRRIGDAHPSWRTLIDVPGLLVCGTPDPNSTDDAVTIQGNLGVVIGTLFDSASSERSEVATRVTAFDEQRARRIVATAGRSLVSECWGSYVTILREPAKRTVRILRGPVSRLPCFWARYRSVTLFFSSLDDLLALRLFRCEINWDAIRAQASGGDYVTRCTSLRDIETVLPGECTVLTDSTTSRDTYWSPRALVRSDTIQDIDEAAAHLRSRVQFSVNTWASPHSRLLMTLSGGLDSSIVLSCLSRAPNKPVVTSVNFFDLAAADERAYARSMAARVDSELIEQEFNHSPDLRMFLGCARTASPVLHFTAIDMEPTCIRLAQARGATAIVYGELGDDILGHCIGPEVLADSIWRAGYGRATWRAIADYAQVKRVSIWEALSLIRRWRALRARYSFWSIHLYSKEFFAVTASEKLATDELLQEYESTLHRFIHPWLQDVADIPPGWLQLIYGLITATSAWSQSPFAGAREAMFLRPLASQPLLEAYARIPAALHIAGGEGGAVARLGFKDALTEEVLSRGAAKGTPEMWLMEVVEQNRGFVKELLLDGLLVRNRILDRGKVEAAITSGVATSRIAVAELVTQMYIEAWLRQWQNAEVRAAA